MNIKKAWLDLFSFVTSLRRSGTTSLIKRVAAENDVWVLVPDMLTKQEFGESGITLQDLDKLHGHSQKPILVDNYTLIKLSELTMNEFENLELKIKERNNLIRKIRDDIMLFERKNSL